jgi:hypothetical protein
LKLFFHRCFFLILTVSISQNLCLLRPFDDFGTEFSACAKFCMRKFKHD